MDYRELSKDYEVPLNLILEIAVDLKELKGINEEDFEYVLEEVVSHYSSMRSILEAKMEEADFRNSCDYIISKKEEENKREVYSIKNGIYEEDIVDFEDDLILPDRARVNRYRF